MVDYKNIMGDRIQPEDVQAVLASFYNAIHLTTSYEQLDKRELESRMVILGPLSTFVTELLKQKEVLTREDRLKLITFLDKINTYKDAITWHTMSDLEREGIMKAADRMDRKAQSAFGPV